jgi:DNA-binding NarL/FixJ family response regulator
MPRIFLANFKQDEHSALRRLILDLNMEIVGESADWPATLAQAPGSHAEKVLVDWDILPGLPSQAFADLRKACPAETTMILISSLDAYQQAALSAGADIFISKEEMPERIAERLRAIAASIPAK